MCRKISLMLSLICMPFAFWACGDDSSSSANDDVVAEEPNFTRESIDDLPNCSGKHEGATVYVKEEKATYVCVDGEWISSDDEENEEKSSDSKKKESSSSRSSAKSNSSSSDGEDSAKSCSSSVKENPESSSSSKNESVSSSDETSDVEDEEKLSITGVCQKGPFIEGAVVNLYELDGETYKQTDKNVISTVVENYGKYSISVPVTYQNALLEVTGYYLSEIRDGRSRDSITLNVITDLSNRENVNINLLTHLEYKRVLHLVGSGVDFATAKKQAETEIFKAFDIQGDFANSEDLNIHGVDDGSAALLAVSILMLGNYSQSEFIEFMTNFIADIEKDGEWNDEKTKVEIAEWARKQDIDDNFDSIHNVINKWEEVRWGWAKVPNFEKYVRNFWYVNQGLGICNADKEGVVALPTSKFLPPVDSAIRYVCKHGAWNVASVIESDTYGETCSDADVGKIVYGKVYDWIKYYCDGYDWLSMLGVDLNIPKETRLNPDVDYGEFTDGRDGHVYKTVEICNEDKSLCQTWMAENLNYEYNEGSANSYCYDNNDDNCAVTGRLYTWAAVVDSVALANDEENPEICGYEQTACDRLSSETLAETPIQGICPDGWHVPSYAEWEVLFESVGGKSGATGNLFAQLICGYNDLDDDYGFSLVPSGTLQNLGYYRGVWLNQSLFDYIHSRAYYWLPDEYGSLNRLILFNCIDAKPQVTEMPYGDATAVRCLKDAD